MKEHLIFDLDIYFSMIRLYMNSLNPLMASSSFTSSAAKGATVRDSAEDITLGYQGKVGCIIPHLFEKNIFLFSSLFFF